MAGTAVFKTVLAPMQDITVRPFMALLASERYGAPDCFVTEFLRVHSTSGIDEDIVETLCDEPPLGVPIVLQLIGEDIEALLRVAGEALTAFPRTVGIDLNMGCPAPKVYKKAVGGGLLKDLPHAFEILRELRTLCNDFGKKLSVKCRLGFENTDALPRLLDGLCGIGLDEVTIHGRTVRGLYRDPVDYKSIALAARVLGEAGVPVIANGDISSAEKAREIVGETGCAGVMCGRHAIRNPWIFRQMRDEKCIPTFSDLFDYIVDLEAVVKREGDSRERVAARMKKYLNFVGTGIDADGKFLYGMRRSRTPEEIFEIAQKFCLGDRAELPFPREAYAGVIARPNCE
ncbi:MAG: tRNA-dihydrouridine synthase family protein [Opitutales bacterium]|nr:tRNA-dihydrouridine synthase family protein [Opitutales bacterium]